MPPKPQLRESYRSLSPDELSFLWQSKTGGKKGKAPRVVEYDKVIASKSLDSLFGRDDCLILFYPNFQDDRLISGHYVALIRHPESRTISFYDPYGIKPDTQKDFAHNRRELYQERENSLIRLMLDSGWNIDYSNHQHQSKVKGVATCGRHSLSRCLYKHLTNDQYNQLIRYATKQHKTKSIDDYVSKTWS